MKKGRGPQGESDERVGIEASREDIYKYLTETEKQHGFHFTFYSFRASAAHMLSPYFHSGWPFQGPRRLPDVLHQLTRRLP